MLLLFTCSLLIQPIEKSCIKSCDVMIMSGLTEAPTANPDTMLGEMCGRMGMPATLLFMNPCAVYTEIFIFTVI